MKFPARLGALLICACVGLANTNIGLAQTYCLDAKEVLGFANSLYADGAYAAALGEFQRAAFLDTSQSLADTVNYAIGICLRRLGEPAKAWHYFRKVAGINASSAFVQRGLTQQACTYTQQGEYAGALNLLDSTTLKSDSTATVSSLRALNYVLLRQPQRAVEITKRSELAVDRGALEIDVSFLAEAAVRSRHKSPLKAGLLSAIIPGAGKIYAGRLIDGLFSALLVGLTTWQAYDGFHDDGNRSVRGWLYGATATTFYAGNVYGAWVAARVYNNDLDRGIQSGALLVLEKHFY